MTLPDDGGEQEEATRDCPGPGFTDAITEPDGERLFRVTNRFLVGLFLGFCFWAVLFPLTNTDIWWHLSAGRYMAQHKCIIYEDPFSYAPEGSPWVNLHWVFQLFSYAVFSFGGVKALVLAKALLFAGGCFLLVLAVWDEKAVPLTVGLAAALVYHMRFLVLVRPIVFTLLFLASFVLVLRRYRRTLDRRLLWFLPVLQVLWANIQGLFPLGPLVIACYLAGDAVTLLLSRRRLRFAAFDSGLSGGDLRVLLWFFLGTCGACFLSPYGLRGVLLPFLLFSRIEPSLSGIYSWNVSENVPTWHLQATTPWVLSHFMWFSVLAIASFALCRRRLSIPRLLLFASFFYLGLIAERNVSLYYFVLVPIVSANLSAFLEDGERAVSWQRATLWLRRVAPAAAFLVLVLCSAGVARASARDPESLGLAPFRYPVEAADILERDDFEGNIFNSVRYGGYLIWRLYPAKKVFIDGRLAIRSRRAFQDYLDVLDDPGRFRELRQRHNITRVAIPTAMFLRYLPLARMLYEDPDWGLLYCDGTCALFAFQTGEQSIDLFSEAGVSTISHELERRYSGNEYVLEAAERNFGAFLLYIGSLEMAEKTLRPLPSADSKRYLARCCYLQGRREEARALSEALLRGQPRDTNSLNLLGQTYLDEGDLRKALEYFEASIKVDPYNQWAIGAIERIGRQLKELQGDGG